MAAVVGGEPDYVVIRPGAGLPEGFLPEDMDGRWIDRSTLPLPVPGAPDVVGAVAVPTGRFEQRDDGAVAEVFEVRV